MKTLKHTIVGLALLLTYTAFAQQGINYKAILKNGSGNVLAGTFMNVQFTIHQTTDTGTIVYQEDHNYTTNANGLVILTIGTDTTPSVGTFVAIDWATNLHFLQTTITYSSGTINFDATEFMAVPYAKHAQTAEIAANVFSGDYNDLTNQPTTIPTGLEKVTDSINSSTGLPIYGWRLIGQDAENYGNIGENAVDLSCSSSGGGSTIRGATGNNSTAMGVSTTASNSGSTAMGLFTNASGIYSTAMGISTTASGSFSTTMGLITTAPSYVETAIGRHNTRYIPNNVTSWDTDDRLFVIGNGTGSSSRSNALTILKNGTITAPSFDLAEITDNKALITKEYADTNYLNVDGDVTTGGSLTIQNTSDDTSSWRFETRPNGNLSMYRNDDYRGFFNESSGVYSSISDRRLKKDITPFENGTLNKVMQLNPVSYLMKGQTDTKRNLGLISQEVQKIFPSITNYNKDADILTLSYTELIPVLIKSIQEQQEIIKNQNVEIDRLSVELKPLKNINERLQVLENMLKQLK